MAFSSSAEYSLWPTEAPSNPTSRGQPSDIIHKSSAASQVPTNAPSNHTPRASKENLHGGVPLTSSQLLEQRQVADYQTSRTIIPIQLGANHSSLPLPVRLPPAMPSRSPTDSPERSGVESSTASNRIGRSRIQRSTSDGHGAFQSNERSQSLSRIAQAKPSRSSDSSPKPPRQSNTRNSVQTHSPSTNGGKVIVGSVDGDMKSPVGSVHCPADKPQLRRQPSVDSSESRHRRSHSADVSRGERLRRSTSNSSLNSFALDSESVKMLPNPRWGGAASSLARSRSFSSENLQSMATVNMGSNCADSFPYGSIMGTDNKNMMNSVILSTPTVDLQPRLQLTRSDASITSYSSGTSIDRSVEPVMTDMTKSAMFKGVTNKGVVKLQLPKDNFRLLSDRDLETGCVYKRTLVDNEDDYFQDYHITVGGDADTSMNCEGPPKQLPPAYYVMAVDADIYQRMFDEVSESISMPCGLFYCGHHDDVDYPSIRIAMVGVMVTFSVMLVATICVGG